MLYGKVSHLATGASTWALANELDTRLAALHANPADAFACCKLSYFVVPLPSTQGISLKMQLILD